jgi:hypothetical protein
VAASVLGGFEPESNLMLLSSVKTPWNIEYR